MNCRDADNLIQESLDRTLSAQDRTRLDAHLQTCFSCAKLWTEYRQIAKTTRAWLDAASGESQDDMKMRVLSQIAASSTAPARFGQAKATLAWAVIAAAAVVAGAFAFVPREQIPDAAHAAVTLPGIMTVLTGDLTALRHFGDMLAQPPIIPVSTVICSVVLISAVAANIVLAQRAARSGHGGMA